MLPQKSLINDWAQIAPKNIINQPGNREVEGRLERKIGAGINLIATLKMIIFPTTPYLASRSICVRFEEQIHIADRNEKKIVLTVLTITALSSFPKRRINLVRK